MTNKLQAIETRYAGCRFRSRLEARWAVAFDYLGIQWQYEPEGFETPYGRYLPDFRLTKNAGLDRSWIEIKGSAPTARDWARCAYVAAHQSLEGDRFRVLEGDIPRRLPLGIPCRSWSLVPWDESLGDLPKGAMPMGFIRAIWVLAEPASLNAALVAARSARFEHGERG